MVEVIACIVAAGGLGLSLILALRLQRVEGRLRELEAYRPPLPVPEAAPTRYLEGLRIAVAVSQDHPHPVFANLLKEQLLREDAAEVVLLAAPSDGFDVLITGTLTCNGYAEIYYQADLACQWAGAPLCSLVERPPHGDRPVNLAIELTTKVKREIEKLTSRSERRDAIRELRGDPN